MKTNESKYSFQNAKFEAMIEGRRLYRSTRGVWHVQNIKKPSEAEYTGTLREIEKILGHRAVKMN